MRDLTIVIVNYETPNLVQNLVNSIFNTVRNIDYEIVVVDNSDDERLRFKSSEKLVKVLVLNENRGFAHANNFGVKNSKSRFILFLNSDDYLVNDTVIEKMVSAIISGGYDFVAGCCNVLSQGDVVTRTIVPCPTKLFHCMSFAHPAFMIKREFINFIGGFDTSYRIAGDYDLILRVAIGGARGIIINDVVTNFRDGGISTTELDVRVKENEQCLIKNINLSERQARFAEKWGYIPTDLLKKILSNVNEPFEVQKIIKNNRSRMIHFLLRQLFTLHLGKNILIRFLGITIINKKNKR